MRRWASALGCDDSSGSLSEYEKKKPRTLRFSAFQRGGRDSNPTRGEIRATSPNKPQSETRRLFAAARSKPANTGERSNAGERHRSPIASVVALPEQSPLLALWERIGQAPVASRAALGVELDELARPRKAAS